MGRRWCRQARHGDPVLVADAQREIERLHVGVGHRPAGGSECVFDAVALVQCKRPVSGRRR
jgi:hypothetical protein